MEFEVRTSSIVGAVPEKADLSKQDPIALEDISLSRMKHKRKRSRYLDEEVRTSEAAMLEDDVPANRMERSFTLLDVMRRQKMTREPDAVTERSQLALEDRKKRFESLMHSEKERALSHAGEVPSAKQQSPSMKLKGFPPGMQSITLQDN